MHFLTEQTVILKRLKIVRIQKTDVKLSFYLYQYSPLKFKLDLQRHQATTLKTKYYLFALFSFV